MSAAISMMTVAWKVFTSPLLLVERNAHVTSFFLCGHANDIRVHPCVHSAAVDRGRPRRTSAGRARRKHSQRVRRDFHKWETHRKRILSGRGLLLFSPCAERRDSRREILGFVSWRCSVRAPGTRAGRLQLKGRAAHTRARLPIGAHPRSSPRRLFWGYWPPRARRGHWVTHQSCCHNSRLSRLVLLLRRDS
jgi:hypothetical protein